MNWDALGAIAELLGAAGVVVSLVYLALQIRRSNVLSVADAQRFSNNAANAVLLAIAQDADLQRVLREGLRDLSSLSDNDQSRFNMIMGAVIGAMSSSVVDQKTLRIHGGAWISDQRANIHGFLVTPGGTAWWGRYHDRFPPMFQRFVAEHILPPRPPAA